VSIEREKSFQLPSGWEWIPIGETGEYINGFAFKPGHREASGLPIVRIQNLTDESKPLNTTNIDVPIDYKIDTGDMLMSWSATLDVFVWRRGPALVNQHIFKVVPDERVMSKGLLFYWLKRAIQQLQETEHLHGSTMMHINRGPFMAHLVPLAPAAEQTRIVAKLEELLSDLDAGVAELKAAQKKLAQYRQSLLKAAVEGALTAAWRTQHQPTETGAQLLQRILQERRARWEARQLAKFAEQGKTPPKDWQKKYPEPVQPDTTDLPELPQGWVWASLDQLALDSSYGTSVKCGYESQGASVLRIPNVIARKLVLDDLKFASQPLDLHKSEYLAPGDILVVRTNGSVSLVGRAAEVTEPLPGDFYFASYLLRVRCLETSVVHRWVSALLASRQGRSWIESRAASSAGQHNLSLSTLLTIPIPLPPIVEQAEAMNALEAVLLSVSEQEQFLDKSLQQSTAQRQNILRAAFSGQLVPQDRHDEPASALLERIRAERAAQGAVKKPRGRKAKEAA
jgi:type I restriction enzyme S subunit